MKRSFFICLFVSFCVYISAMDWPSTNGRMVHNFGWNDNGQPLLGTSFESDSSVEAAENGEIFFTDTGSKNASRLPSPLGAWTAIDHGDGLISIYSRFGDRSPIYREEKAEKGNHLASSGTSGWSNTKGFYFSLFDRKERRWVNPAMIISRLPDTQSPVIHSVLLQNSAGGFIDPAEARSVSQGRYTLSVEASDTLFSGGSPLAPYRITCLVNGSETGALNFETYSARDGTLLVYRNGLVPVKQVYAPVPRYEIGEVRFTRGQVTLEIIAQDISGNSRSIVYRLVIE
jgi:hypothetical protein